MQSLFIIIVSVLSFLTPAAFLYGQPEDEKVILSYDTFMELVKDHHPLARQAENQSARGEIGIQEARGGFDPKLFNNTAQKNFKDTRYYSIIESGLKIPTWFGIELQGGYDLTEGQYLNPQNRTPEDGLWYGGISLALGEGLFIDERRAQLQKAKIFRERARVEQQVMLNQLLFEAGRTYWEWFRSFSVLQTYEEAVETAADRFNAIKRSTQAGDMAAIDTIEAGIQVQKNEISYNDAKLEYENSTARLGVFLWMEGFTPLEIAPGTVPEPLAQLQSTPVDESLVTTMESTLDNHPLLLSGDLKIDELEVDRRLGQEQFKPTLNVKYNLINETLDNRAGSLYSLNNQTWGLEFEMPLFFRKERAKLRLAGLKLADARLDLENYRAEVHYKIQAALNEWENTHLQTRIYTKTLEHTLRLLEGEQKMFMAGESSLFMVNTRQMSFIDAQVNYLEYLVKNRIARIKTLYQMGILPREGP